jgi:hypothetical protein
LLRVPAHGFVFVPDLIECREEVAKREPPILRYAGLIRWSRTRMRVYLESVATTVHQIHPLNDAAKADADLAIRETTGSTCCCCRAGRVQAAVSRHRRLLTR